MNRKNKIKITIKANALNYSPDEYDRKIKNQRNWQRSKEAVEHGI